MLGPRPRARRDHRRHLPRLGARRRHAVDAGRSSTAARPSPRKIANNAAEFDTPSQDRRVHRGRPGALRPHLRRQRDRPDRHRAQEGLHRMTTHLSAASRRSTTATAAPRAVEVRTAPTPSPTDRPSAVDAARARSRSRSRHQGRRRPDRHVGRPSSSPIVPLVWILCTVISQGRQPAARVVQWWTNCQRNINSTDVGGGAIHAIQGTLLQAGGHRVDRSADRHASPAIYLVEYGRGAARPGDLASWSTSSPVCPSIVAALFIYAVWVTTFGFQRVGVRGLPRARPADDPGRRPLHRGDAQARPQRAARGVLRPRRAEVDDHRRRSCCRPPSPASSPASCSAWPGSWARRRRC